MQTFSLKIEPFSVQGGNTGIKKWTSNYLISDCPELSKNWEKLIVQTM